MGTASVSDLVTANKASTKSPMEYFGMDGRWNSTDGSEVDAEKHMEISEGKGRETINANITSKEATLRDRVDETDALSHLLDGVREEQLTEEGAGGEELHKDISTVITAGSRNSKAG